MNTRPAPPQAEAGRPVPAVRPGYLPERRYQAEVVRETWRLGPATVDTVLLAPASREPLPLVLYLPGLGEAATAGERWRRHWAEAGYAVLSLQPAGLGEAAWQPEPMAAADDRQALERQRRLALERHDRLREQYAAPALAHRLDLAARAVAELHRRSQAGSLPAAIDVGRLVVVGYDLGAQTAAALAGEQVRGLPPPAVTPTAVILLSPYVELGAGTGKQRFAAMGAPLLAITGSEDDDPDRLVSTPNLRRIPWQSAPAGDKYLLVLENGIHATLAGNDTGGRGGETGGHPGDMERDEGRPRRGGGAPRALPFGDDPGDGGPGGRMGGPEGRGRSGNRAAPAGFGNPHSGIVQTVSTAFLDAVVKNDPVADEWLRRDATRWLAGQAGLWIR